MSRACNAPVWNDKLKEAVARTSTTSQRGPDLLWLANDKALKPELAPLIRMVGEEYGQGAAGTQVRSAHVAWPPITLSCS